MGRKKVAKCLVDNEKKMQKISYANTCICNDGMGAFCYKRLVVAVSILRYLLIHAY